LSRHGLVNPLALGRTAMFTIQAMIHAALVQIKYGLPASFSSWRRKSQRCTSLRPRYFMSFFSVKPNCPSRTQTT
jgi:hypothetical protein